MTHHCYSNNLTSNFHTEAVSSMVERGSVPQKIITLVEKKMSPAEFANLKSKSKCRSCGMYEHWTSEHAPDVSLFPTVRSTSAAAGKEGGRGVSGNK